MIPLSLALALLGLLARDAYAAHLRARFTDDKVRAEVATFRAEMQARIDAKDKEVAKLTERLATVEFKAGLA